jgi:hypothetical protein
MTGLEILVASVIGDSIGSVIGAGLGILVDAALYESPSD